MSRGLHCLPVRPKNAFDERTLAVVLMCILSSIVLLGSSGGPPLVAISTLPEVEEGTTVKASGVLVDLRLYDSGAEGIVIADLDDGAVAKIISTPGIKAQPSAYARIGDELLIEGEVSVSGTTSIIFTSSDDVLVVSQSELVLTVESVSRNWFLFEGDVVRIKGFLERTGLGIGLRLYDRTDGCSIAVIPGDFDLERFVGSVITLTATLRFDHWLSALVLVPSYAVLEQ